MTFDVQYKRQRDVPPRGQGNPPTWNQLEAAHAVQDCAEALVLSVLRT